MEFVKKELKKMCKFAAGLVLKSTLTKGDLMTCGQGLSW